MSTIPHSECRIKLIFTLWSLLFTKCFVLEFCVRHYAVPIHSLIYVWSLSIFMAVTATIVYLNLHKGERNAILQRPDFKIYSIGGFIAALLVAWALTSLPPQDSFALAMATVTLGVAHLWMRVKRIHSSGAWVTRGWFAGAILIIYSGSPGAYLVFAICIFCLATLPGLMNVLSLRKQQ